MAVPWAFAKIVDSAELYTVRTQSLSEPGQSQRTARFGDLLRIDIKGFLYVFLHRDGEQCPIRLRI